MRELANDRVVFTGYAFGDDYAQLSRNCLFYVLASGVDGTRPVLLDQMGFGNCVVIRSSAANSEVVGEAGIKFDPADEVESLAERMSFLVNPRRWSRNTGKKRWSGCAKPTTGTVSAERYLGCSRRCGQAGDGSGSALHACWRRCPRHRELFQIPGTFADVNFRWEYGFWRGAKSSTRAMRCPGISALSRLVVVVVSLRPGRVSGQCFW